MTTPSVPAMLEITLHQLDTAKQTLALALVTGHLSAMHPTYTAAIKRIMAFNAQTTNSVQNLVTVLKRRPHQTQL